MKDSCRVHGTLENQFPDQHPHLESKIIKIGQETPEIWGALNAQGAKIPKEKLNFFSHFSKMSYF